jgi:hypothetical protein
MYTTTLFKAEFTFFQFLWIDGQPSQRIHESPCSRKQERAYARLLSLRLVHYSIVWQRPEEVGVQDDDVALPHIDTRAGRPPGVL